MHHHQILKRTQFYQAMWCINMFTISQGKNPRESISTLKFCSKPLSCACTIFCCIFLHKCQNTILGQKTHDIFSLRGENAPNWPEMKCHIVSPALLASPPLTTEMQDTISWVEIIKILTIAIFVGWTHAPLNKVTPTTSQTWRPLSSPIMTTFIPNNAW